MWNGREATLNGIIMQHYSDLMESQCKTIQISWNHNAKTFRSLDNTHKLLGTGGMAAKRFLMESACNTIQIFGKHIHITSKRWNGREATLNGIILQHDSDLIESQCNTIQISWNHNATLFRSLENTCKLL